MDSTFGRIVCGIVALKGGIVGLALCLAGPRRLPSARSRFSRRHETRDTVAECLAGKDTFYIALSLFFGLLAVAAKRSDCTLVNVQEAGIMGRLALASYSAWFYLIKTFWPTGLHAFPMRPDPLDWTQAPYVLSMLGLVVVSIGLFHHRRRYPGGFAAWVAYLFSVSSHVRPGHLRAAGHWRSLQLSGADSLGRLDGWLSLPVVGSGRSVDPLAYHSTDYQPNGQLGLRGDADGLDLAPVPDLGELGKLWTQAVRHGADEIPDLHNNLGVWQAQEGNLDVAVGELKRAIWLRPDRQDISRQPGQCAQSKRQA